MGSDWGTHGEESYPEAAWLQLEVFRFLMLISFQSLPSGFSCRFLVFFPKLEVFEFPFQSSPSWNFNFDFPLHRIPRKHSGEWTVSIQHCKRSSEYLPMILYWRHQHKADWNNILKSFSRKEMKKAEAEAEQYRFQQTFEQANNQGGQQGF